MAAAPAARLAPELQELLAVGDALVHPVDDLGWSIRRGH